MVERITKTSDEFFDIIDDVKKTWWVTIGYVTGANLNVPTVQRKNPATNRMKKYPDYTTFRKEGDDKEIGALVSITAYNFQYFPTNIAKEKYKNYKKAANIIRREFGIPEIQDKENDYTQTINYGNGISAYGGKNPEKMGHTYTNQNVYGANIEGVTYLVSTDGNIIRGLSDDEIKPYLKAKREIDGVAALRKINAQQEVIDNYISRIKELKYKYKRFESSSILWMVATTKTGNEKIVYINDKLQRAVDGININPEAFLRIAKKRYNIAINEIISKCNKLIKENMKKTKKNIIRLTESDLRHMITESVKRILKENAMNPIELLNSQLKNIIDTFGQEIYDSIDDYGDYQMENEYELSDDFILYCDINCTGRDDYNGNLRGISVEVLNLTLNDGENEYTEENMPELEEIRVKIENGLQKHANRFFGDYKDEQDWKDTENGLMSWGRL